ncbi:MAG: tetratricopeptide repeat protein [Alphaproteobacteria bacterium]
MRLIVSLLLFLITGCVNLEQPSQGVKYTEEDYQDLAKYGDPFSRWQVSEQDLIGNASSLEDCRAVWSELKAGKNKAKKEAYFKILKLAEKGLPEAQELVLGVYEKGENISTKRGDYVWLKKASNQDSDLATYELIRWDNKTAVAGQEFIDKFMPYNKIGFARWFGKTSKDIDEIKLAFALGRMYDEGIVVKKDYAKAALWYNFGFDYVLKRVAFLGKSKVNFEEELFWAYSLYDATDAGSRHLARWILENNKDGGKFEYDLAKAFYFGKNEIPQDREAAYKWYFKAAYKGYPDAMYLIGAAYDLGGQVEKDSEEAAKWYQKAADAGQEYAMVALANILAKSDRNQAQILLQKAVDKVLKSNSSEIKEEAVGDLFTAVVSKGENISNAVNWYQKAVAEGSDSAGYKLGQIYESGKGADVNYQEAAKWYQISADRDFGAAQVALAKIYLKGLGNVRKDINYAVKLLMAAAEKGSVEALVYLGRIYLNGENVVPNYDWAEKWLLEAARRDKIEAEVLLGINYFTGEKLNKDLDKAYYWLEITSDRAKKEALDILNEAYNLRTDKTKEAQNSLFLALDLAVNKNNPQAQMLLAKFFDYGITDDFDSQEIAKYWYEKAGLGGISEALFTVGKKYFKGTYGSVDYDKAARYIAEAAKQGNLDAEVYLGWILLKGYGFTQNTTRAYALFAKAAEKKNSAAEYYLGLIYEKGLLGQIDIEEAVKHYLESSKGDNIFARKSFCELYDKSFVESADRFAAIWCKGKEE